MDVVERRGVVVLDCLFLIIGVCLLIATVGIAGWITWPTIDEGRSSNTWSAVPGRIVHSRVDVSYNSDNERQERAFVQYLYSVDGVELAGDRVAVGGGSFENAFDLKGRYPVGKKIDVFVNGEEPWETVLEPGVQFSVAMFVPLLLLFLGLLFTFLPLRSLRRGRGGSADVQRTMSPLFGGCLMAFGAVMLLLGSGVGYFVVTSVGATALEEVEGEAWATYEGTVRTSAFADREGAHGSEWSGRIEFEYEVQGETKQSTAYRFEVMGTVGPDAKAVFTYRPGETVDVFINERDPAKAYLEVASLEETLAAAALLLALPGAMCIVALALLIQGFVAVRR